MISVCNQRGAWARCFDTCFYFESCCVCGPLLILQLGKGKLRQDSFGTSSSSANSFHRSMVGSNLLLYEDVFLLFGVRCMYFKTGKLSTTDSAGYSSVAWPQGNVTGYCSTVHGRCCLLFDLGYMHLRGESSITADSTGYCFQIEDNSPMPCSIMDQDGFLAFPNIHRLADVVGNRCTGTNRRSQQPILRDVMSKRLKRLGLILN